MGMRCMHTQCDRSQSYKLLCRCLPRLPTNPSVLLPLSPASHPFVNTSTCNRKQQGAFQNGAAFPDFGYACPLAATGYPFLPGMSEAAHWVCLVPDNLRFNFDLCLLWMAITAAVPKALGSIHSPDIS